MTSGKTATVILLGALVLALTLGPGAAQAGADGARERPDLFAGIQAHAVAGADVDGGAGSVAVTGARAVLGGSWGSLGYGVLGYRWSDASRLPFGNGGDPWNTLHSLRLDLRHEAALGAGWGWFVGGGAFAGWEQEMDDAAGLHARAGVRRVFGPELRLSLGVGVVAHKTGLGALPVASLAWGDEAAAGLSAVIGVPETWLRFRFDDAWRVRLGVRLEGGTYRLADDSGVVRGGYVRQSGLAGALLADWSPLRGLTLSFGPEWRFARRLTLYNSDGDEQDSYGVDAAPGFGLGLRYVF